MSKKFKLLKNYPAIVLLFISILSLGLFTDGSEFGHTFEKILSTYSNVVFRMVPVICIVINIYTRVSMKLDDCTAYELVTNCKEIKQAHKDVYVAFLILGGICTITVYPIMVTFLIMFVVWSMQFQTGYIGKLGMRTMLEAGIVNEHTYNQYLHSRYIIFKDIKVVQNISIDIAKLRRIPTDG